MLVEKGCQEILWKDDHYIHSPHWSDPRQYRTSVSSLVRRSWNGIPGGQGNAQPAFWSGGRRWRPLPSHFVPKRTSTISGDSDTVAIRHSSTATFLCRGHARLPGVCPRPLTSSSGAFSSELYTGKNQFRHHFLPLLPSYNRSRQKWWQKRLHISGATTRKLRNTCAKPKKKINKGQKNKNHRQKEQEMNQERK